MLRNKNKRGGHPSQKRAPFKNTGDNGPNANGSYWAAELARPPPNAHKTFNSEFPPLPGTTVNTSTNDKDNWISPADLQDPNEWSTGGVSMHGWNTGISDAPHWDKTTEQVKKELAAQHPQDTLVDTSEPVDLKTWKDPTPVKTAEKLREEQVEKNCMGWPWTGVPRKLITLVRCP
jgi:hypothetical protein